MTRWGFGFTFLSFIKALKSCDTIWKKGTGGKQFKTKKTTVDTMHNKRMEVVLTSNRQFRDRHSFREKHRKFILYIFRRIFFLYDLFSFELDISHNHDRF